MKLPKVLQTSVRCLLPIAALLAVSEASAQIPTYSWDAQPGTPGNQDSPVNGAGVTPLEWNLTNNLWTNELGENVQWDNSGAVTAIVGALGDNGLRDINVTATINLSGLALYDPAAYRFTGTGTLNFTDGSQLAIGPGSTTSGNQVAFNTNISGSNLGFLVEGTAEQFINLSGQKDWDGNLDLGGGANFFVQANGSNTLNSLDSIRVGFGTTLALAGANQTYSPDISIAGTGPNNRGAIRISSNNITLTGRITMAENAMISTQDSGFVPMTGTLTQGIGESQAGLNFTKSGTGELIIQGASNYTGTTTVGPTGATSSGGTLTLDFANSGTLVDLLYNDVATNTLRLVGATSGAVSRLNVIGKAAVNNSQTFSGLEVTNFTEINASSGAGGTMTLDLGTISRTASNTYLTITAPAAGSVKASNNGLLGPWAKYLGETSGWAGVNGGTMVAFTGDLPYVTGTPITSIPGHTQNSNLRIGGSSEGNIQLAGGTTGLNTISMVDPNGPRTVPMNGGGTIRLGAGGGIQVVSTAKQLIVGSAPGVGTITAGTAAGAELYLASFAAGQPLLINATITDNAGGDVDVLINGTEVVQLAGNNTYTGTTRIVSGVLQARSNGALGSNTTGNTIITDGAVLEFANNITGLAENISVVGGGIGATGAIRNASGHNRYTGVITLSGTTRIGADAGRLTLGDGDADKNVISGTTGLVFSGDGEIEVKNRIATSGGTLRKEGNGTLILSGNNTYTGNTTIAAGAIRASNVQSLGTSAGGITINGTGALELADGVTITESLNTSASNASGAIRGFSGNSTFGGTITLSANTRIQANAGAQLTLDVAAGSAIASSNSGTTSNRFLVFGGPGEIVVKDAITQSGTGAITLSKEGVGDLTLQGNNTLQGTGRTAIINVNGGKLILDHGLNSSIISPSHTINLNGGTLEVRGGAASSTPQLGELLLTSSLGYSTLVVGENTTLSTGNWTRPSGHFLFVDLSAAGSKITASPGALGTAEGRLIVGNTSTGIGSNASFVMKDANGRYDFAAVTNIGGVDTITRLNATTALPTQGGSGSTPSVLVANALLDHTLTAATSASTLRIDTTQSEGVLDLGSNTLNINRAALLMDGSNDFTIKGTGVVKGNAADALFLYNYGTGALNIEAKLDDGDAGQLFFAGTGLIDWKSEANAGGNVWLLGGATLRLSHINSLTHSTVTSGNGSGQLRIGSGGILELAQGDLTRDLGTSRGMLEFLGGDGGGFSAYGGDRFVDLQSGGSSANLVWGSTNAFLANGEKLIFGSPHANAVIDLKNNLNLNGGNQVVDVQSVNATGIGGKISGNITDTDTGANGSLTKIGRGVLTLAGNNSYKGITAITEGTLDVTGSLVDTTLVTVFGDAKLQVRESGTVSAGAFSLLDGSEISLELGATTGRKLVAGQNFSLEGNIKLSLQLTADPTEGTLFTLLDGSSALAGYTNGGRFVWGSTVLNDGDIFDVLSNGILQPFQISYGFDGGADVAITAVPEPGTVAALLTSVGFLLGVNRFRRPSRRSRVE